MLVLSRKRGERIYIGDDVIVTVTEIERGKVRLGIEAPRDKKIYRQELLIQTKEADGHDDPGDMRPPSDRTQATI